jgi:hypothetical protein
LAIVFAVLLSNIKLGLAGTNTQAYLTGASAMNKKFLTFIPGLMMADSTKKIKELFNILKPFSCNWVCP